MINNKLFNITGFALTPPAFLLNLMEWLENMNLNQSFTFLISVFVVVFWYFKIKEQKFKALQAEKECDNIPDHFIE